jgi:hypothetical protein
MLHKTRKIAFLIAEGVEDREYYVASMHPQEEGAEVLTASLDMKSAGASPRLTWEC